MKNTKLERLEKKFNIATQLVKDLDDISTEFQEDITTSVTTIESAVPATTDILDVSLLKQDFLMVRQNIQSLVAKGQRILDQTSTLDLAELKASQIEALSNLQATIGKNLSTMMEIYKTIAEIERYKSKTMDTTIPVNMGTITNNNILFEGTPNDLLTLLREQNNK